MNTPTYEEQTIKLENNVNGTMDGWEKIQQNDFFQETVLPEVKILFPNYDTLPELEKFRLVELVGKNIRLKNL